jgi:P27 family predicted phage terminase small subunit
MAITETETFDGQHRNSSERIRGNHNMPMPRKSEDLHKLHSTKPHDRAADISHVATGRPRIPADVNALGLRAPFKKLCRLLSDRRVLTDGDVELIRLFIILQDRHSRNIALLRDEGELCTYMRLDSHGTAHPQVKTNLRLKVVTDAERQMAAILSQLGLTPTAKDRAKPAKDSRGELHVIPGSAADMMPEMFGGVARPAAVPIPIEQLGPPEELFAEEESLEVGEDGKRLDVKEKL